MDGNQRKWNELHDTPDGWYPNEFVIRFLAKYVKKRIGLSSYDIHRSDIRRVLDLGCGTGRHSVMLANEGYEVSGIDVSPNAIQFARQWLASEGLTADLMCGTAQELPWRRDFFDAVISHGVLDHMTWSEAMKASAEVHRVVRPEGLFYLSLISIDEFSYGQGRKIEPHTFILTEGNEEGLVQRFYAVDHIFELLSPRFKILDIVYDCWKPCYGKGFSAIGVENANKLARYHIAAERLNN